MYILAMQEYDGVIGQHSDCLTAAMDENDARPLCCENCNEEWQEDESEADRSARPV